MKKLFNRKQIEVTEIATIETSWGYHYSLYKTKNGSYAITYGDGSDEIEPFATTDEDAIKDFEEYMKELEKENEDEIVEGEK